MKLNKLTGAMLASTISFAALLPATSFASSIPGAVNDHIPLGTAYNSLTGEFLNFQTVKGQVKVVGNTSTSIKTYQNMDYEQVSSRLSGDVTIDADFPVVQAEASADLALETASDAFSSNWVMSVINVARSEVLRPIGSASSVTLSDQGQDVADENLNDSALIKAVGDEFVTEIEYSTQLFVSMKAEYLSTADKDAINGAISVDFALGEVEGDLSYLSEEQKQSVKITVRAHQFGGSPLELLTILPDNIITCDLTNFTPCETLFEEAIKYAKGIDTYAGNGFKDQVADIANSNVVGYKTEKYDQHFGTYALAPSSAYTKDNNDVVINQLENEYVEQLENHSRATSLLGKSISYLNETQRAALRSTAKVTITNAEALRDLVNFCSTNVYNGDCNTYLANNCPVEGNSRSCLKEYSTDVFNQAEKSEFDLVLSEYSHLVRHEDVKGIYVELMHQDDGDMYNPTNSVPLTVDYATGKLSIGPNFAMYSVQNVTSSFLLKSTAKYDYTLIHPGWEWRDGYGDGYDSIKVYKDGTWQTVSENSLEFDEALLNSATQVDGYYYYLVEMRQVEYPIIWFLSHETTHDYYFYRKPQAQVNMTTGVVADGTPFYFTRENINVDKDVDGNTIGWCNTRPGWTTGDSEACAASGRLYTWHQAAKACEAYNDIDNGSTGLVWSLPTKDELDFFIDRVEQDSGAGNAGYWLKSFRFDHFAAIPYGGTYGTNDDFSMAIQPSGYDAGAGSTNVMTDQTTWGGFWTATETSASSANLLYVENGSTDVKYATFGKSGRNPVRCIGKYAK